jgi:hypothetical protein
MGAGASLDQITPRGMRKRRSTVRELDGGFVQAQSGASSEREGRKSYPYETNFECECRSSETELPLVWV